MGSLLSRIKTKSPTKVVTTSSDFHELTGFDESYSPNDHQLAMLEICHNKANKIVRAKTSSGKTAHIYLVGDKYLKAGKSVVYIGSLKALVDEKYEDWNKPNNAWKKYPKVVISGDFKWTDEQQALIDKAQIIAITPESLVSRLRHYKPGNPKTAWMENIGLLAIDEIHQLTADSRGANFEVGIMEFILRLPDVEILALSGTFPNIDELKGWISSLNGKKTYLIESDYRPVPLEHHYIPYNGGDFEKIQVASNIIKTYPKDQFMVGVWKKTFGYDAVKEFDKQNIPAMFHNANLERLDRKDAEGWFKKGGRVLVCTSTLFTGVNLPAKHIIITSTEAGGKDIPVYEIEQASGRAGRPQFDTEGHVWYLIAESKFEHHKNRLENGEEILSQLSNPKYLATHFLGAIYIGHIKTEADFHEWFGYTFCQYQSKFDEATVNEILSTIIEDMQFKRMIKRDALGGNLLLTRRGIICVQLMLSPYSFGSLLNNIGKYSAILAPTDLDIAKCFGCQEDYWFSYNSWLEKQEIPSTIKAKAADIPEGYWKACTVILDRLKGERVPSLLGSLNWQIFLDLDRTSQGVLRAHSESERWESVSEDELRQLIVRIKKCCSAEVARFHTDRFTNAEMKKLMKLGIHTFEDARINLDLVLSSGIKPARLVELGFASGGSRATKRASNWPSPKKNNSKISIHRD